VNFSSLLVWEPSKLGICVLSHLFQLLECVRALFDRFFAFILQVFASFHRFHILALGHLVALCIEPSVGGFGSLIAQSTSWLLFYTCSVVVKSFLLCYLSDLPLSRLDSAWLRFGPRSYDSLKSLWFFLVWRTTLVFRDLIVFSLSEICFFTLCCYFSKFVYCTLPSKRKQTISFALH